ncbi:hypothetical protein DH2020_040987 [Rehmannia glutinosa]|uniref:Uncharacterized protein n=1 Tax=Rehmannia glutinosa TaxID=99300 RepID=A0ABR0URD7_REHGL
MPGDRHCPRIDTIELKLHIERRLGQQKAEKYFNLLNKYFSHRLGKSEFDKLCIGLLGRENTSLHNGLIRAIIKNACSANAPPPKRTPTVRDRRSKDRPSPLGPNGKAHIVAGEDSVLKVQEQQSATEILSLGSRPPVEVTSEEGEEVEQIAISPGIHSRTPLKAPLGISLNSKGTRKVLSHGFSPLTDLDTCYNNTMLPDTSSLRKKLEQKLGMDGLNVSTYCVNLINNGVDMFLKRLLKPCLDLAASRSECTSVSMTDFEVAMQSNPRVLGEDWPVLLEHVAFRASEDYMDG